MKIFENTHLAILALFIFACGFALIAHAAQRGPGPGASWSVVNTPSVSNQATASEAAVSGYRHVADCVDFSGGSTTAPTLTEFTVNLRDGATGAGTVLKSWTVIVTAAAIQNVAPFHACGIDVAGSNNTAMTLEFSASLTNLFENVSLSGHDIPN